MTKTWDGILLELFNVGDRSIAYSWNPNLSVKVEAKDPKQKEPPKKAAAPGKNDPAPLPVTNTTM